MTWYYLQQISNKNISTYQIENNSYLQFNSLFNIINQQTTDINQYISKQNYSISDHSIVGKCQQNLFQHLTHFRDNYHDDQQEFVPNHGQYRKSRKTPQNANRNVIPNIMHQVISFLQKKNKSQHLVKKLINKFNLSSSCSVKRFYLYQLLVKDKLNHYVNVESLDVFKELHEPQCQVYSQQQQINYNKISRLLIHHFLTQEYNTMILTSKRVNSDKKFDHLLTKRKILQQISKMFSF